jgi:HAD superfamily hydrolase (TIGR01509 family)
MNRKIKGILFDWDGTLTRPGAIDFEAIKREMGCPPDQLILEFLDAQPARFKGRLMAVLDRMEDQAAERSLPNTGVETCLTLLKKEGFLLGILTRNSLSSVSKAFCQFDSIRMDDFTAVVTRQSALPKPHPDGVLKGAALMGLSPSELCVVGDFRFDVMAGHAAGAATILLTNGGQPDLLHGDPAPDYVISQIEEILPILLPRS